MKILTEVEWRGNNRIISDSEFWRAVWAGCYLS